jgi:dephospho-CoA kinase
MTRTAITGGIGSGKSYVCRLLRQRGIDVYDCDTAAKRLMRTSPALRQQLTSLIGPEAYTADDGGRAVLNKAAVARFLLQSQANAKTIDDIVHPAVAADFMASGMQWLESAILFQADFHRRVHFDHVVVVTAPEEVRLQRIMERDGITRQKALDWIRQQWTQQRTLAMADYEIVNDGLTPLEPQIENILQSINTQGPVPL